MTDRFPPLSADPAFFEAMLARFRADPGAVDADWRDLFVALGEKPALANGNAAPIAFTAAPDPEALRIAAGTMSLLQAYRTRGHLAADWDPLGLSSRKSHPDLDPAAHCLSADELSRTIPAGSLFPDATPNDMIARLQDTYCGTLSAEFMHLDDPEPRLWLQDAMESGFGVPDAAARRTALDRIIKAESFENFMQVRFPGAKRFGMEGSESQLPLAGTLLDRAAEAGVEEIFVGPMHRGRTTFMAAFMGKPLAAIFSEFAGNPWYEDDPRIAGDVTYHMGHTGERRIGGRTVKLTMPSHPSHVEAIIAVSLGMLRARQSQIGKDSGDRTLGLMMHTDAGFTGQGVVYETLQLARLANYETGGSIHVIANNQVGFTTNPEDARSSTWCSDPAKLVQSPVLRVNGDDPDAAVRAAEIAVAYQRRFRRDILIDLVCYRRRGHNELDEPRFTQPEAYAAVDALPTVRELYARRLADDGIVTAADISEMFDSHKARYEDGFQASKCWKPAPWPEIEEPMPADTGIPPERMDTIAKTFCAAPDDFTVHPKLLGQLEDRRNSVLNDGDIGWPAAEALAIGSLLQDGTPVRLSGQDTRRGTFSQRHAVLFDQKSGAPHVPLGTLGARFDVFDTPLSEEATVAFEYGYAAADPATLVMWEAQFGDFINGAQIIVDQFLAAGETKWLTRSAPVLLLPHGLEAGGPEHSSARLERFLQLAARNNIRIAQPTAPANFFHLLRRHMLEKSHTPLVVLAPKQMLRHKRAVSSRAEFLPGTSFSPVLADANVSAPITAVLCTGRTYYDLLERRAEEDRGDIGLIRVEELYPFPDTAIAAALPDSADIVWCQEEPANMGAWSWIAPRIEALLGDRQTLRYIGRPESPSPSEGFKAHHEAAQARVLDAVFAS